MRGHRRGRHSSGQLLDVHAVLRQQRGDIAHDTGMIATGHLEKQRFRFPIRDRFRPRVPDHGNLQALAGQGLQRPLQIVVATITNDADDYAKEVMAELEAAGLKAELDIRNEKINYKIREHSHTKVPVILVVGAKEAKDGTVAMRRLGGKDQENLALKEAAARLKDEAAGPLAGSR